MPSKQETFDTVVAHLRKQGRQAIDEAGNCQYRAPDGCKCAVGCLIPDDKYSPDFEGLGMGILIRDDIQRQKDQERLFSLLSVELGHDMNLLCDLQDTHDCGLDADWEDEFKETAEKHGLTYTPPAPVPN